MLPTPTNNTAEDCRLLLPRMPYVSKPGAVIPRSLPVFCSRAQHLYAG